MTAEIAFENLRLAMLAAGYTKEHQALQALARLRKTMRERGYKFQIPVPVIPEPVTPRTP